MFTPSRQAPRQTAPAHPAASRARQERYRACASRRSRGPAWRHLALAYFASPEASVLDLAPAQSRPADLGAGARLPERSGTGWIWSRESQKEIAKEREAYRQRTVAFQQDLEAKYHAVISENRRAVAQLSLELEKEQNRTTSYREALISQGRKLVEEKKLLEREWAKVMQERSQLQPLRSVYLSRLEEEEDWQRKARLMLKEVGEALAERQNIYCSLVTPRRSRLELEKNLLVRAAVDPVAADLEMAAGLTDIFKHDTYCGDIWNSNKRQNGRLMWLYLKYWELVVELKKFKRVEKAILEK
ncbi:coiled-coil domain-containing protein 127 isoform X2 [Ictidomys tridecemlineatus]